MYIFFQIIQNIIMITVIIILLLLWFPLRIQYINNDDKYCVNIILIKSFNIKVNIKKGKNKQKTFLTNYQNIINFINEQNFFNKIFKKVKISKITLVFSAKNIFSYVLFNNLCAFIDNYIINKFSKVNDTYYNVIYNEKANNSYKQEIVFSFFLLPVILLIVFNYKKLTEIISLYKKEGNYGTSN